MKILLFGALVDVAGSSVIEMNGATDVNSLKELLIAKYPLLNSYQFSIAVNKEKIEKNITLNDADEIALLPPFAGG